MLEVKSPWNNKHLDNVPQNNEKEISDIIEKAYSISKKKGLDFKTTKRIYIRMERLIDSTQIKRIYH